MTKRYRSRTRPRPSGGFALLEVLAATTILAGAALAMVLAVREGLQGLDHARAAEEHLGAAGRIIAAAFLLHRSELDQRVGRHPVGEFVVAVTRPEPQVFRVAVADSLAPDHELLVTLIYRDPDAP